MGVPGLDPQEAEESEDGLPEESVEEVGDINAVL